MSSVVVCGSSPAGSASLISSGNGTPNGIDAGGTVAATTSGALRYFQRPAVPAYTLKWMPPTLVDPIVVYPGATTSVNTAATGDINTGLDNTKDYIIVLDVLRTSELVINGGRNIWVIGGHVSLATQLDAGIYVTDTSTNGALTPQMSRIVHIEGVLVDNPNSLEFDGIDYACPSAIVQIQNCRVVNLLGDYNDVHADISQNQGGATEVRYDHFTGTSNYQGITAFPHDGTVGGLTISNVDLSFSAINETNPITFLFWNEEENDGTVNTPVSIIGTFVVSNNRSSQTVLADAVWSSTNTPATEDGEGNITFPAGGGVTGTIIDGNVNTSAVPSGGFCPIGNCGIGYVTPGYGPAKQPNTQAMFIEEGTTNVITNPIPTSIIGYSAYNSGVTLTEGTDGYGTKLSVVCDGSVEQQGVMEGIEAHVAAVGQTFTASCYLDGSNVPLVIEVVERSNSGGYLTSYVSSAVSPGSTPDRTAVTYTTVNSSTAYIQVRVRITGSTPLATTFNVRQLQLEQKGYATTYCDGTQTDCSWTGTASSSSSTRPNTRVQFPVSGHITSLTGSVAIWANLPILIPLTYLWSVGTPGVSGQDFLGVRVNSGSTSLELVAQTGTAIAVMVELGAINAGIWAQVNATWSGTYMAGSINDSALITGTRSTQTGSLNTAVEVGGLTDGTGRCNGYLGPLAISLALYNQQFAEEYDLTTEWDLSLLTAHLLVLMG
jgi:hypothetical protein